MADPLTTLINLLLAGNWAVLLIFLGILILIAWVLGAVFMFIGLSAAGGKHREFGNVMVTVLIGALVGWIPCLGCILYWYMIKIRHETGWGGAIVAWLIAGLIPIVIALIVGWIIVFTFLGIGP